MVTFFVVFAVVVVVVGTAVAFNQESELLNTSSFCNVTPVSVPAGVHC